MCCGRLRKARRCDVGSLFSGIGGLDHGLARAGFRHAFFCESDPWRRTVLAHHFPGVPIYEDVAALGHQSSADIGRSTRGGHNASAESDGELPRGGRGVDLIAGGFPCQDISVAGRRAGLAGERSGLFYEFARIAESLRPRWLLVENVPGLFSSNGGRDFGAVLGTLADIGYGLAWRILDSRYFGVPQRRRRVFILGADACGNPRAAAERCGEILAVGTRCARTHKANAEARPDIAPTLGASVGGGRGWDANPDRTALVAASLSHGSHPNSNLPGRRREDDENLVATSTHSVRRLTPTECERLQALPDGWTDFGPDSRRYAALGDAVTTSVAEWIGRRLIRAGVAA